MAKLDLLISTVSVLANQAKVLPQFVDETSRLLAESYTDFEIILIDNASHDDTPAVVKRLLTQYKCVRYQRMLREVDGETAITAGLDAAIGDYVVCLHPDYDPVDRVVEMVDLCRSGHDVVLGIDETLPPASLFYTMLRALFVIMARWMTGFDVPIGATGFRVFSRHAVNAITRVRSRRRYFVLISADIGLTTEMFPYRRASRSGDRPRRRLIKALRKGLSVLVHYSNLPLRVAVTCGLFGSGLSLVYTLYVVLVYLFKSDVMPGWTSLSLQTSGLFTIMFLILALMGEYLNQLLEETTDRPLYHVRDELTSAVMLSDLSRRNVLDRSTDGDPANGSGGATTDRDTSIAQAKKIDGK